MSIIENKTLVELHEGLRNKEFTSVELTKETFERIHALEPKVEAFLMQDLTQGVFTYHIFD